MKRIQLLSLALMLICVLFTSKASAQATEEIPLTGFNIGGYVGGITSNLNQILFSDFSSQLPAGTVGTVEVSAVTSVALGVIAQYDLHKYFSLESGFSFLQQGTTLNTSVTNGFTTSNGNATLKASYLQLPILAVGKINVKHFEARLGLGGYFSTKLGESKSTTTSGASLSGDDAYTSSDAGIRSMLSLGYCFGRSKINIMWRNSAGIAEILNGIETKNGEGQASFNSRIVALSFTYNLSK